MKRKNIPNKYHFILTLVFALLIHGFNSGNVFSQSLPDPVVTQVLGDGIYVFNSGRVLKNIDFEATYAGFGVKASQNVIKTSQGNAVFMKDDSFIDPETGIRISVNTDGSVFSPDNDTIQGKMESDGSIVFTGVYEENSQSILISLKGILIYRDREDLAGEEFSGEYRTTDAGTGRKQVVRVKDGLYLWEYETPEEGDFMPWPVTVEKDGSFKSEFEFTVKSEMAGLGETVFNTLHTSRGILSPDGSITVQNLTVTNGTSMAENRIPNIFEGVRVSAEERMIFSRNGVPDTDYAKTASNNTGNKPEKENPEWYTEKVMEGDGFYISCGEKTFPEESTALKIAESIAAGKIISILGLDLDSKTESEQGMSGETETNRLFESISTVASRGLEYEITGSFYDKETGTAFVRIRAKN